MPRTLADDQVLTIVDVSEHLRDRFLIVLLAETGMRWGRRWGCGTPTSFRAAC